MTKFQPTITDMGNGFRFIDWPAYTYIESTGDQPICIDESGEHLGEKTPGVAIPFPTRRHGELHKHFGICEDDDGQPLAYGKGATLTSESRPKAFLAAARIGQTVIYKGNRYIIRQTANENIALEAL
jgi:hypothetical protein